MREIWDSGHQMVLVPAEDQEALSDAIIRACATRGDESQYRTGTEERLSKFSVRHIVEEYSKLF